MGCEVRKGEAAVLENRAALLSSLCADAFVKQQGESTAVPGPRPVRAQGRSLPLKLLEQLVQDPGCLDSSQMLDLHAFVVVLLDHQNTHYIHCKKLYLCFWKQNPL